MVRLIPVAQNFIDQAWKEGAHKLSEACDKSGGEITGDQLKYILARGGRTLLKGMDGDETVGWCVVREDNLPNVRVLHVCEMYCPGGHYERFYEDLERIAKSIGCSRIRCCCDPIITRMHKQKLGFAPLYTTLEKVL